ncbi:seminal metalloprotease 1-like [Bicyclus anynana]|uniref:Metalloendopeptidase n=1 Tax=Bicyclus anynana TaxID=110368 RepID=A0A6J1P5L6_BICAN|nr:seminal metalloprotease 1-like [Bicyclus anynana]
MRGATGGLLGGEGLGGGAGSLVSGGLGSLGAGALGGGGLGGVNPVSGLTSLLPIRGLIPPDINPEEYSGQFQGDIVLDEPAIDYMVNQYAMVRSAVVVADVRWPNNTVVWQFNDNDFDEEQQAAIQEGMQLVENNTCIRFRLREPGETVYVNITGNATGCYSMVGYGAVRGMHVLNYAPHPPGTGCLRLTTVVHELMHILGILHMHSTHDRDNYVRIVEENIAPGMLGQFFIAGAQDVSNLGVPYDYLSCMHYSSNAFSANGNVTIEALQEVNGVMGQRDYITDSDWLRINRHYDCPGAWDE